jgi:hypothetical protein
VWWRNEVSNILWELANFCRLGPSASEGWKRVQELKDRFPS